MGRLNKVFPLLLIQTMFAHGSDIKEYCEAATFQPQCHPGAVILMTHAHYGRMKLGLCVKEDYGYLGCSANVIRHTDRRCSGRNTCHIRLPDSEFDSYSSCPPDLKTYLAASYECVEVLQPQYSLCDQQPAGSTYHVTNTSRFLSSIYSTMPKCGKEGALWTLVAPQGQKLKFTLYALDFTHLNASVADGCREYVTFYDQKLRKTIKICQGDERVQEVFVSSNNSIEVYLHTNDPMGRPYNFLLQYQVIGCPDLQVADTRTMWFQRVSDTTAMLLCHSSGDAWKLHCRDGTWISDNNNSCSYDAVYEDIGGNGNNAADALRGIHGLPLAIIIALALLVGITVFLVGLVLLCRLQRSESRVSDGTQGELLGLSVRSKMHHPRGGNLSPPPQPAAPFSQHSCESATGTSSKIYEQYRFTCERYTPVRSTVDLTQDQTCVKCQSGTMRMDTKPVLLRANGRDVESVLYTDEKIKLGEGDKSQCVMLYPVCERLPGVHEPVEDRGVEELGRDRAPSDACETSQSTIIY